MKKSASIKTIETTLGAIKGGYLKLTTVIETAQNLIDVFNCKANERDQVAILVEKKMKEMLGQDNSSISASKDLGTLKLYKDTNERTKVICYVLRDKKILVRPSHFLDSPKDIKAMKKMDNKMEKYGREQRRTPRPDGKHYKQTT